MATAACGLVRDEPLNNSEYLSRRVAICACEANNGSRSIRHAPMRQNGGGEKPLLEA